MLSVESSKTLSERSGSHPDKSSRIEKSEQNLNFLKKLIILDSTSEESDMKTISVKVKIFIVIITLSVFTLGVFGLLSFNTYKKDKMAFVYDHLSSEVQSSSMVFSSNIESYDAYLSSVISGVDTNSKSLGKAQIKNLEKNQRVQGIYLSIPQKKTSQQISLFESSNWKIRKVMWEQMNSAGLGLSLMDRKNGTFLYKKSLSNNSYAVVVFKQQELSSLLYIGKGRFNFLLKNETVISKDGMSLSRQDLTKLTSEIKNLKSSLGLFETTFEGDHYLVAYSKLNFRGMILVNAIQVKKVLMVQDVFVKQFSLFLLLMISVSLLIGTISGRWFTWHLDRLKNAALEMKNENFDTRIEVINEDELGTLGLAFNAMGSRIKYLLEELKQYNTQLEIKVQERTIELQYLSDMQKAMLNSLGQGFVIINKDYQLLSIYSRVAEDMFEVVPNQVSPTQLLGLKTNEGVNYKEFFGFVFDHVVEFDDMAQFSPSSLINSKNQQIQLSYAPITNSQTNSLEYIMVIGTDKTAEIESMEKFKKEWAFSQMILKIAKNRDAFNKILKESLSMLDKGNDLLEMNAPFAIKDAQRFVHTIKGSFAYFNVEAVAHKAHNIESDLNPHLHFKDGPAELRQQTQQQLHELKVFVVDYIDQFENILKFKESTSKQLVSVTDLNHFYSILNQKHPQLAEVFTDTFQSVKVDQFFKLYPDLIKDLAIKLDKEVQFSLIGGDINLPAGPWEEIFGQFIHVVRNSLDHGIESAAARVSKGKTQQGHIKFKFEKRANSLVVNLSDDGKGIDWQAIARKDNSIKTEEEAIRMIMQGGVSSKDEVSETSGRGVGVSSLFSCVERLGGQIKIKTQIQKGTEIEIEIPLYTRSSTSWSKSA